MGFMTKFILFGCLFPLFISISLPALPAKPDSLPSSIFISHKEYLNLLYKKIGDLFLYPYEAKEKKIEGVVKMEFYIDEKGYVHNLNILKSSGIPVLDNAALFIIKHIQPLQSPLLIGEKSLKVIVPIEFSLEKVSFAVEKQPLPEEKEKLPPQLPLAKKEVGVEEKPLLREKKLLEIPLYDKERKISLAKEINDLFSLARHNSQPLKIAKDQIGLANVKVSEVFRNLFPSLGLEYTSTKGETITDPYRSKSYGVKCEHILYDHKQRSSSLKRERINVGVAEKNYEKVENELLFEFFKAYYQLLKEKGTFEIVQEIKNSFENYFALGETLEQASLITKVEHLKVESFYNRVKAEEASQKSRYDLALANLKKVIGIKPLEDLPSFPFSSLEKAIVLEESLSSYIDIALEERPEITLWEKSIEATELGYKIAKVENRPKFIVESFWGKSGESYGYQSLDLAETWNVLGKVVWLLGGSSFETSYAQEKTIPTEIVEISSKTESDITSLKFNLLDKMKYFTETQEGKVALKQAKDELIKLEKDIAWEVHEGFSTYQEAKQREKSFKKEIEMESQELALREELFRAGEVELSDVMNTHLRLLQSKFSLLKAHLDKYLGVLLLEKATGFNLHIIEKL